MGKRSRFGLAVWLLAAGRLLALHPSIPIRETVHTAWTGTDGGLLPPVYAVAQGPDGYLWVSTARGVLRFDGLHFGPLRPADAAKLPPGKISLLTPTARGGLWAVSGSAATVWEGGKVWTFAGLDGILGSTRSPVLQRILPVDCGC